MVQDVYVGTRIPESLKAAFQEALEKDGRQYSIAQIMRYWIERYVASAQDQGESNYAELKQQIAALKAEVEMQIALKDQLFGMVEALFKLDGSNRKEMEQTQKEKEFLSELAGRRGIENALLRDRLQGITYTFQDTEEQSAKSDEMEK